MGSHYAEASWAADAIVSCLRVMKAYLNVDHSFCNTRIEHNFQYIKGEGALNINVECNEHLKRIWNVFIYTYLLI